MIAQYSSTCWELADRTLSQISYYLSSQKSSWADITCAEMMSARVSGIYPLYPMVEASLSFCCGGLSRMRCSGTDNMCEVATDFRPAGAGSGAADGSGGCPALDAQFRYYYQKNTWSQVTCRDYALATDWSGASVSARLEAVGPSCCGGANRTRRTCVPVLATCGECEFLEFQGTLSRDCGGADPLVACNASNDLWIYDSWSGDQITDISPDTFTGIGARNIYLISDAGKFNISTLKTSCFQNLPNVETIVLSSLGIASIETGAFRNLTALQSINLHKNVISVIAPRAFYDLPVATSIYLTSNLLSVALVGIARNVPNLRELYLAGNPGAPFSCDLVVQGSAAPEEDSAMSAGLTKSSGCTGRNAISIECRGLRSSACLADCAFFVDGEHGMLSRTGACAGCSSICLEAFSLLSYYGGSGQGTSIKIPLDKITGVKDSTFEGMARVDWLHISEHRISSVTSQIFRGLTGVQSLNLTGNGITDISPNAFVHQPKLVSLDLRWNPLSNVKTHHLLHVAEIYSLELPGAFLLRNLARLEVAGGDTDFVRTKNWDSPGVKHCIQLWMWSDLLKGYRECGVSLIPDQPTRAFNFKAGGLDRLIEDGRFESWCCIKEHFCGDPWYVSFASNADLMLALAPVACP